MAAFQAYPQTSGLIDRALESGLFPALAVSIRQGGREVYRRFEGFLDPSPGKNGVVAERTEPDSLFDLASLTKVLSTTILALRAWEAGALSLEDRVGSFLPRARAREVKIRDILRHASGLPAIPALQASFPDSSHIDRDEAIARLLALPLEYSPGTRVLYSCSGFLVLGLILERISGTSLARHFDRELARPLGLDLGYWPRDPSRTAATEFCPWRKRRIRGEVHDESAYCLGPGAGNAGLFGRLDDVASLGSIFLSEGNLKGKQVLSPASIALMTRLQTPGLDEARALGFLLHGPDTQDGPDWPTTAFGHTGFTGTSLFFEPLRGLQVTILTNRIHGGREATAEAMPAFRKAIHGAILAES